MERTSEPGKAPSTTLVEAAKALAQMVEGERFTAVAIDFQGGVARVRLSTTEVISGRFLDEHNSFLALDFPGAAVEVFGRSL